MISVVSSNFKFASIQLLLQTIAVACNTLQNAIIYEQYAVYPKIILCWWKFFKFLLDRTKIMI